ncbi:replicative DNA helicase [Patescibacteria group bacterium]|nr:replicative DNA helicase [Patescibacteria group bacterium]
MSNQENLKVPPHNLEAEESLLGSLMIDKDSIIKVADMVNVEDFYKKAHSIIFETIKELYNKHEPLDILSLTNRLEEHKRLESIGGRSYLLKLSNSVATSSHVVNYAQIVQKKAILRRLINAASEIHSLGFKEADEVDGLLDQAEQKLFSVSQASTKSAFSTIDSLLNDAFARIDDLHKQTGQLRGLTTGYRDLDGLLSGLQKSDLIILAARPSVGKTTFALDVARHAAIQSKKGVGIFSLEMSKEQLVDRMLCAHAGVGLWKMRTGQLSDKEENNDFARIAGAMGELAEAQIHIDDTSNCNIMEVRTKCRRLQVEKGLGLVVIDYLQLMEGRGKSNDNRVQEVAEISRGLKGIAREMDIPVIALSQLSRTVEQSKPAIPKLSHLRESGSIEQDADIVMFLYRKAADRNFKEEELTPEELTSAELYIAKHRNGPTGKVDLYFDRDVVSYKSVSKNFVSAPPEF